MHQKPATPTDRQAATAQAAEAPTAEPAADSAIAELLPAATPPASAVPADSSLTKRGLPKRSRVKGHRPRGHPHGPEALTPRQLLFVEQYLLLGERRAAALRAGYSESYASANAYRILLRPDVQAIVAAQRAAAQRRTAVTIDMVIGELAKLAFADPRDLFTPEGRLKPMHSLDDASAASIAALEVLTTTPRSTAGRVARSRKGAGAGEGISEGEGARAGEGAASADAPGGGGDAVEAACDMSAELRKIKRWDKVRALELLGRYLGLFKDRLEVGVSQDLAASIEAARQRVQTREVLSDERAVIDVEPAAES
jgi:phage terminase small subunit